MCVRAWSIYCLKRVESELLYCERMNLKTREVLFFLVKFTCMENHLLSLDFFFFSSYKLMPNAHFRFVKPKLNPDRMVFLDTVFNPLSLSLNSAVISAGTCHRLLLYQTLCSALLQVDWTNSSIAVVRTGSIAELTPAQSSPCYHRGRNTRG